MDAAYSQLLTMMNPALLAQLMQPSGQPGSALQQAGLLSLLHSQPPLGLQGAGDFMGNVPPPVTGIPGQAGGAGALVNALAQQMLTQQAASQQAAASVQPSVGEPGPAAPPSAGAGGQVLEGGDAAQAQASQFAGASAASLHSMIQAMAAAQAAADQSMAPPAVPMAAAAPAVEEAVKQTAEQAKPETRRPHYWTDSEKQAFVEVFKAHGRDWKALSARFPEKTLGQLKAFYQNWRKRLELDQYVLPPAARAKQAAGASGEKAEAGAEEEAGGVGPSKASEMATPAPPTTEQADEKAGEAGDTAAGHTAGGAAVAGEARKKAEPVGEQVQSPTQMEVDKALLSSGGKSKASAGSDKVATGSEVQEMDVDHAAPDTDVQGAATGAGVAPGARPPTGPQTSFLSGVHSGERIARSSVLAELGNEAEDSFVSVEHPGPAVAANVAKPRAAGGLRPPGKAPEAEADGPVAAKAANPTLSHAQAQALALAHAQAQLQAHALQAQVKAQARAQAEAKAGAEGPAQEDPQEALAEQAAAPARGCGSAPRSEEARPSRTEAMHEGLGGPAAAGGAGEHAVEQEATKTPAAGAAPAAQALAPPPPVAPAVERAPSEGPGSREGTLVTGLPQGPPERAGSVSAARAALSSAATGGGPRPPSSQAPSEEEAPSE